MTKHAFCTIATAATLAIAAASTANLAFAAEDALKPGSTLPADIAFTDSQGNKHTFGEFRGKPLVLEWTNPGCPFVRKFYDAGAMQKQQEATVAKGVTWLTVNSSAEGKEGYMDAKSAPAAVAKEGFKGSFYILDGMEGSKLGKMFGASTTPHMFVADKEGKLVYAGAIDSIPSFSKADIAKAENYVNSAVDAVLAGKTPTTTATRSYGCSVKY